MGRTAREVFGRWQTLSRTALRRVEVIALFPILVLSAYAMGGPKLVLAASMVLPSLLALLALGRQPDEPGFHGTTRAESATYTADRGTMLAMLERIGAMHGMESACFLLEIDAWDTVESRIGTETARDLRDECQRRIRAAVRGDDLVAELGPAVFGVVLHPIAAARLGIRDAIANRLRAELGAPIVVGETSLRLTASVGHAPLAAAGSPGAEDTITGATLALEEAKAAGPGSVRSFVPGAMGKQRTQSQLTEEVPSALLSGAITAWFQPQIEVQTGEVAGFEALARWNHPSLGVLGPGQFLGAVENAGRFEDLGKRIRQDALAALRAWDAAGHLPITVSVNASDAELRNPSYAEEVAWDLDAIGMPPERLIVEVLESVAADARDDTIMATLAALRSQGIALDLDDFGVGQASLLSIRRFGVARIKIDRSFVTGIDRDPEQQAMVGGIVSLGRTMGLGALAEGVETPEEEAALTQLGCSHVQGFGIAEPMPLSETLAWLASRNSRRAGVSVSNRRIHSAE
jgi:EAL domain-containing protein (putative c-di-GMP-specific phosphodiesterase class I)/GGDEF domain-containing protein